MDWEVLMRSLILFFTIIALSTFSTEVRAGNASLRGGISSQKKQNHVANKGSLSRMRDLSDLKKFVRLGLLVPVTNTTSYELGPYLGYLDPGNSAWYRYSRPWTKRFLDRELGAGHRATGHRFKITSLVRTKMYQKKLVKKGANAISGKKWWMQSSHLTGATVDISYKDMSPKAQRWLEKRLLQLERRGLIEATKEHRSLCFHIMIFPSYGKIYK